MNTLRHSRPGSRPGLRCGCWAGFSPALSLLLAEPHSAFAQGKLDARYEVTLAGIPVGKGAWIVDIAEDQFSAAASGGTSGLLKAFAGGSGVRRLAGPHRQRRAGGDRLFRHHQYIEEIRSHPHGRWLTAM